MIQFVDVMVEVTVRNAFEGSNDTMKYAQITHVAFMLQI